jgi:hypothetical protein
MHALASDQTTINEVEGVSTTRWVAGLPKVQRYSGVVEDFLYRIEQRALPVAQVVEVVP